MFYLLLIGLVVLFGYLVWRHRWRLDSERKLPSSKLANETPSSSSTSTNNEDTPSDLQAANGASDLDPARQQCAQEDLHHVEEDRRLLQEYTWASYKGLPPAMQRGVELIVLKSLLQTSSDVSYDACSACLQTHEDVRALLLEGWKKGTFEALRMNSTFLSLGNPGERTIVNAKILDISSEIGTAGDGSANRYEEDNRMDIEPVQGTKEVNIYGGNIYNVAGDVWRVTYSSSGHCVAEWFFPIDYRVSHNEISKKRSKNTGGWLLRSKIYGEWCISPQQRLMWCPGIPGVGKTVMASLVVDHLRTFDDTKTFIGVIYFNYKLRDQQSKLAILEALCRQMFEFCQHSAFQSLYDSHAKQRSRPTEAELRSALSAAFQDYQHCYLVLDALDEYTAHYSDKQLREIIETILTLGENVKLLITSRVLGEMKVTFEELGASREEIIVDDNDLRAYLVERIESLRSKLDFEVSDVFSTHVVDKVMEASKGRFLVAELGMNLLSEQLNLGDLEDALENLPNEIDETYIRVVELVKNYSDARRVLAMNALMWVAYANRRLSVRELQHALATKYGKKETDKYVTPLSTITGLCAGLIVVQDEEYHGQPDDERIVRFVHFTTQEFFGEFQSTYFANAHEAMFSTCVEYLSIMGYHILSASFTWSTFSYRHEYLLPFYDYATHNWGHHADQSYESLPGVLEFLRRDDRSSQLSCDYILKQWNDSVIEKGSPSIFLAAYHDQATALSILLDGTDDIPYTESHKTPLHIAAIAGRTNAMKQMLQWSRSKQGDLPAGSRAENKRDSQGRTPLSYAADHCQLTARVLIEHEGIEVDLKDNDGRTPFSYAAQHGQKSTINLLFDHGGVEVDSKDQYGQTPFSFAAQWGQESVVKRLLEHRGVEVDSKDNDGRTPFSYAAQWDREPVAKLLLEHGGVEVDLKDKNGQTPFSYAVDNGSQSIIKLLLAHGGVEVDLKGNNGQTPFSVAAQYGWESTVKLLLEHGGAEVDSKDADSRTPLSFAAQRNQESIINLLLGHGGVDVDSKDRDGRTPFSYAAEACSQSTIKLLIEHGGVDLDSKDNDGRTPFAYAAWSGSVPIVKFLLKHGHVDVDSKDNNGRTPFSYAVQLGNESVINLLLEHGGVDVDSKDNNGRTPFSYAAENCMEPLLRLLLNHGGVQANTQDGNGRSALSWASGGSPQPVLQDAEAIQHILAQGVDVNLPDNKGRTALYYARQGLKIYSTSDQRVVDLLEANGAVELPIED